RRFPDREVVPIVQEVHRKDLLLPMDLIQKMAALGVFGLTVPEKYGGLGMGKVAMCVVTEELSRGYIAAGSLGTRAEIAAELILGGGTQGPEKGGVAQKGAGGGAATAGVYRTALRGGTGPTPRP